MPTLLRNPSPKKFTQAQHVYQQQQHLFPQTYTLSLKTPNPAPTFPDAVKCRPLPYVSRLQPIFV
jgi:hypothetical protein